MNERKGKHIISASRRTDIPKFYSDWFMKRIQAGYCMVPNPLFPSKVYEVSLKPEDVLAIVFWSKDPSPMIHHLPTLNEQKFCYYFQFTLNNYGGDLEPCVPDLEQRINTFLTLSDSIGRDRVIWRYDPIIWSNKTQVDFHLDNLSWISRKLKGATERLVISFSDDYKKTELRLAKLKKERGYDFQPVPLNTPELLNPLLTGIKEIAKGSDLRVFSCAEDIDLAKYDIEKGSCIDAVLIKRISAKGEDKLAQQLSFDQVEDVSPKNTKENIKKDPNQRSACSCAISKDIGANNTCRHGCAYCYATSGTKEPSEYNKDHDSGWNSITRDYDRAKVVA